MQTRPPCSTGPRDPPQPDCAARGAPRPSAGPVSSDATGQQHSGAETPDAVARICCCVTCKYREGEQLSMKTSASLDKNGSGVHASALRCALLLCYGMLQPARTALTSRAALTTAAWAPSPIAASCPAARPCTAASAASSVSRSFRSRNLATRDLTVPISMSGAAECQAPPTQQLAAH